MQDDKGDLWICSDHGIIAFDGISMRSFTTENGLPGNTVFKCFPDPKGRLWFTTRSNGVFWIRNDTVHIPDFNDDLIQTLKKRWVDKLYVDEQDGIWMSTFSADSVFYKSKVGSKAIQAVAIPAGKICKDFAYFLKKDGKCVFSGRSDAFLFFSQNNCLDDTLLIKNYGNHQFLYKSTENKSGFSYNNGKSKFSLSHSRIYFSNGREEFEWFSIRNHLYHLDSLGRVDREYQYSDQILDIFQNDEQLIISVGNSGIYVYENLKGELLEETNHFKGLIVSHIYKDRSANYWISIVNHGLFKVNSFDVSELYLDSKYTQLKNISKPWYFKNDSLLFLVQDSLFIFKKQDDKFKLLNIQNIRKGLDIPIPSRVVWDKHSSVYGEGWNWDYKEKKFRQYFKNLGASAKWIFKGDKDLVVFDFNDGYIISEEGQTKFDSRKNNFNERIRSILIIDSSHHYVGSLSSFHEFKNGGYTDLGESDKRLKLRVEDIKMDDDGKIWLATRGSGLAILFEDSLRFIGKMQGLSSNLVNKIFMLENQIFVATNRGLDRLIEQENGDFMVNSIYNRSKGSFALIENIFETKNGVIVQNGNEMTFLGSDFLGYENFSPSVIIKEFSVAGRLQNIDTSRSYSLKSQENSLGFKFRINALQNENQPVLFEYRLVGLNSIWQSTFGQEINFRDLKPGKYEIQIRAKESNSKWSKTSSLSFEIENPFYLQLWFIALMLLIVSGIFFYYIRFRALQNARSKELISSNIRALKNQMNPHFIFNSLNSIQYFIVTNQKREANIFLAKLSDLVRNVLNTTNESSIELIEELNRIEDYVQLEQMRLSNSFEFHIANPKNLDLKEFNIPPMLIQPLIENAIWHGLANLDKGGLISLEIECINTELILTIIDNGEGMDIKAWEGDPTNSGKGNSIGLFNVKQRLHLLSKIKNKEFSIRFENIQEQSPKGTKVILKIPQ